MNESMDQEKRPFYFTFGVGQGLLAKRYVRIDADAGWKAREVMQKTFGTMWSSMYGAGDYDRVIRKHGLRQLVINDEPIDVDIEFVVADSPTVQEFADGIDWGVQTPTQVIHYLAGMAGFPPVEIIQAAEDSGDEYEVVEIKLPNGRKIQATVSEDFST